MHLRVDNFFSMHCLHVSLSGRHRVCTPPFVAVFHKCSMPLQADYADSSTIISKQVLD